MSDENKVIPFPLPGQSESVKAITSAMCKAIPAIPDIKKSKKARIVMKTGGTYTYDYADLSDILAACVKPLAEQELMISWSTKPEGKDVLLTCFLRHASSGEWMSASILVPMLGSPQDMGSVLAYYKRYTLGILIPVAATEPDDDGAHATKSISDDKEALEALERATTRKPIKGTPVTLIDPETGKTATPERVSEVVQQAKDETAKAKQEATDAQEATKPPQEVTPDKPDAEALPPHLTKLDAWLREHQIARDRFLDQCCRTPTNWLAKDMPFEKISAEFVTKFLDPKKTCMDKMISACPPVPF